MAGELTVAGTGAGHWSRCRRRRRRRASASGQVVDGPGDQLDLGEPADPRQPRRDQRVVDPHRLDPQLRQLLRGQPRQAVAHRDQRRQHRSLRPALRGPVLGHFGIGPAAPQGRRSRGCAACASPSSRSSPARSGPSAQRLDDLLLPARQLDVEVDLDLVDGGSRKASSASVSCSGVRRSASSQSWATTNGARCSSGRWASGSQSTSNSIVSTPASTAAREALDRVPGRDQVGALVADQAQLAGSSAISSPRAARLRTAGSRRRRSPRRSRR